VIKAVIWGSVSPRHVAACTLWCSVVAWPFAVAAENQAVHGDGFTPRVETLIVTGMREQPLAELPRSAAAITAADIELSPSLNIVDLLAREANVVLRSTAGNDKFSGVDIRGQGDTYSSNVIVMVDGIRLNAEDLSGADFSVVPLDQIERVEVIRGANTVRYGNGAVGGVINIITKTPAEGAAIELRSRIGSYQTTDVGADASFSNDAFFLAAGASRYNTDGYRDNSDLEKKDLRGRIGITPADWLMLAVGADTHRDVYGLPGPAPDYSTEEGRRGTNTPNDGGRTNDDRWRADLEMGNAQTGVLRVAGVRRDRLNSFVVSNFAIASQPGEIQEDSDRLDVKYEKSLETGERRHFFNAGIVADQASYARRLGEIATLGTEVTRGDIRHKAWFLASDLEIFERLRLSAGYRADSFSLQSNDSEIEAVCQNETTIGMPPNQVVVCLDPGGPVPVEQFAPQSDSWRNEALETGLVYSPSANINWYLSFARSFRNPNVDELALPDLDNAGLMPQTGRHLDAGVRAVLASGLEIGAAIFYVRTDNEILFALPAGSGFSVNFNSAEPTERRGGELDLRWAVSDMLTLTANAGYTRAQFKYSRNYLPLVPKWTGGAGAQVQLDPNLTMTVTGNYVGRRFDGNDFNNQTYAKVDRYATVDAKLVYDMDNIQLYVGIGNLLDEVYSPSVYSNNFYPMPDRNYYAGFSYRLNTG